MCGSRPVPPKARPAAGYPAVTISVTKQPGRNAVDVSRAARARASTELRNTLVPAGVEATIVRDYGETAAEKANKLIQKLAFGHRLGDPAGSAWRWAGARR